MIQERSVSFTFDPYHFQEQRFDRLLHQGRGTLPNCHYQNSTHPLLKPGPPPPWISLEILHMLCRCIVTIRVQSLHCCSLEIHSKMISKQYFASTHLPDHPGNKHLFRPQPPRQMKLQKSMNTQMRLLTDSEN